MYLVLYKSIRNVFQFDYTWSIYSCWIARKRQNSFDQFHAVLIEKKFFNGICFTNTKFDNPFPCIDADFIHPEYSEEALENLMEIQANLVKKKIVKQCFVIFDDCLDDPGEFQSAALKRLSTQLRHYNIALIMSTQYCNLLPPRIRTNATAVFIFQNDCKSNLESLYESFGQRFDSYKEFKNYIIQNLSENYRFIYYDKNTTEKNLEDIFQVMLCPPKIPKFKIKN